MFTMVGLPSQLPAGGRRHRSLGRRPRVRRLRHFRLGVVLAVTSAVVRHAELARQSHVTT